MNIFKYLTIISCSLFLFSCATNKFVAQNFNPYANTHVKAIKIIESSSIEEVPVTVRNHAGMSFGVIGMLVASADISDRTTTYNNALSPLKIEWQDELKRALQEELKSAGYQVNIQAYDANHFTSKGEHILKEELFDDSDAVLFTSYHMQYMSAGMSDAYQPYIIVNATLYDKNESIIYSQIFHYGFPEDSSNWIHIAADKQYSFQKLEHLVENVDVTADGLKSGLFKIAAYVGQDLQSKPTELTADPALQSGAK